MTCNIEMNAMSVRHSALTNSMSGPFPDMGMNEKVSGNSKFSRDTILFYPLLEVLALNMDAYLCSNVLYVPRQAITKHLNDASESNFFYALVVIEPMVIV